MAYPTTAALVAGSSNASLLALDSDQQDALRLNSISQVEDYCGQGFGGTVEETRHVDGSGLAYLLLPARLASLTSLLIVGIAMSIPEVEIDSDGWRLTIPPVIGDSYYARAIMDLDPWVRKFPGAYDNIHVEGVWGWAACPDAVESALRLDMEDQAVAGASELSETVRAFRRMGLRDIRQGNLSASLMSAGTVLSLEAQSLLRRYVAPATAYSA